MSKIQLYFLTTYSMKRASIPIGKRNGAIVLNVTDIKNRSDALAYCEQKNDYENAMCLGQTFIMPIQS
jgi:hypothetical protein